MTVAEARFTLVDQGEVAAGRLELVLNASGRMVVANGIFVDLLALARNDFGALTYPPAVVALFDDERMATLTDFLLPHLRLLVRGRVVPLDYVFRFGRADT